MSTLSAVTTATLDFCTLGMFIIDEIDYTDGKARAESIIGGAGTYAAIGARLVAGREFANRVGWIVDVGSDFPPEFRTMIDSWQTSCVYRYDGNRLTTRAWNGYGLNEYRAFKYLTPKLRLDENSLSDAQVMANAFHLVCSSQRCIYLISGIMARRERLALAYGDTKMSRPRFVWEPVPDLCVPEELDPFKKALRYVDVVSPNAEELASFFTLTDAPPSPQGEVAAQIVQWGIGPDKDGVLVVREGGHGCTAYSRLWNCHLPAFYQDSQSSELVDPTGGGNTFLGGLAMAIGGKERPSIVDLENQLRSRSTSVSSSPLGCSSMFCALVCATVAASFAIQQMGMPRLSYENKWNGESFAYRVNLYMAGEKWTILANKTGNEADRIP